MKGDRYFETYTKKRRSGCSNDSVPEKTTISSLPDPMQATEGEWKIIEVVGMPQPPGTRIIFYAHYPFEDLSFYDMITKPDTNAHHKIYKLHEALQKHYDPKRGIPRDYNFKIGELVAARSHRDGIWYRGAVFDIEKKMVCNVRKLIMNIYMIDYGNYDKIASIDVFPLDHKFTNQPVHLQECCLSNVTLDFPICKRFSQDFVKLFENKFFLAKMDHVSVEGLNYVTIYDYKSTDNISFNHNILKENVISYSNC